MNPNLIHTARAHERAEVAREAVDRLLTYHGDRLTDSECTRLDALELLLTDVTERLYALIEETP